MKKDKSINNRLEDYKDRYKDSQNIFEERYYERFFNFTPLPKGIKEEELDFYDSPYRLPNENEIVFGDFILFQVVNDKDQMTLPMLGLFVEYSICDQALEWNIILPPRVWMYNNLKPSKFENKTGLMNRPQIIERFVDWDDCLYVFGHWKSRPTWKEIRKAMRTTFYYRPTRKQKIERVLRG